MLRRLFGKTPRQTNPVFDAPLSPDSPFCVVGDIHGCLRQLDSLLEQIDGQVLGTDMPDVLVCVGDYIDRGDHSAEVLDRLRARQADAPERTICLMGNHERMMLDFLDAPERAGPRWLRNGGMQTLTSYCLPCPSKDARSAEWQTLAQELREQIGMETENWLRALPLSWRSGNVAVVHAGADPRVPLEKQKDATLLWGHPEFGKRARDDGIWTVHGHTIVAEPEASGGRIATDTGAFATGRLTAAVIAPGELRFLSS